MRTMTMRRHSWPIVTAIVLTVWLGVGVAEAGVIFPVGSNGLPDQTQPVTVSLFELSGRDVTDEWLPTWRPPGPDGPTIYVTFNALGVPATPATVLLKEFTGTPTFNGTSNPHLGSSPTTSKYPGRCTNFGSETSSDYTFPGTQASIGNTGRVGFALTSQDCGGMAVIEATIANPAGAAGTYTFVIPQDSNGNGIPDVFEARFCSSEFPCLDPRADIDAGPVTPSPTGDGISVFDEYRGFIVGGAHVPTDPRRRDLFVHLVKNAVNSANTQCGAPSRVGFGGIPTDGSGLFDNLATLLPGSQVHLLQGNNTTSNEWVDRFASFSLQTGFLYNDPNLATPTSIAPLDDRQINKNAIYPVVGAPIQKGLRSTECAEPLPLTATQPLASSGLGTPNGPDNSLVFTQRILTYIDTMISNGGNRARRVFTFENGSWVQKTPPANSGLSVDDFLKWLVMKYMFSHELTHAALLTATVQGTRQTSYGYHQPPGTGSVMDQTITQKIDKSLTGFNSFYIPSAYNGSDQSTYTLK